MTKNILCIIFLAMGLLFSSGAQAKSVNKLPVIPTDTISGPDALFEGKPNLSFMRHFAWGAEFGSSIDLTGHNLSTFNLDLNFGYKNSFLKLVGVGVGFHRGIISGDTYIPIYGVIRTSFRSKPSLFFLNVQAGYSFNTVGGSPYHGDIMSALGVGINLSQGRRAKSYVILSAGGRYFNKAHLDKVNLDADFVITAKLMIGVNF